MATRAKQTSQQERDFIVDLINDGREYGYTRSSAEKMADLSFTDDEYLASDTDLESIFNGIDESLHHGSLNSDGYFESSFVD